MYKWKSILLSLLMLGTVTACTPRETASADSPAAQTVSQDPAQVKPTEESSAESAPAVKETPAADGILVPLAFAVSPGQYPSRQEIIQLGDRLAVYYLPDRIYPEGSPRTMVELFDAATGESLWSQEFKGMQGRLEKYSGLAGYDYRFLGETEVLYGNSADPTKMKSVPLPQAVIPAQNTSINLNAEYDLRDGKLVWRGEDGVYLGKEDGSGGTCIMPHAALVPIMAARDESKVPIPRQASLYVEPHLLDGGNKVAATIYAPDGESMDYTTGIAIYDVQTKETTYYMELFGVMINGGGLYPDDETVGAWGREGLTMIDAKTGTTRVLPYPLQLPWEYYTVDFNTFVVSPPNPEEDSEVQQKFYLCGQDSREDTSQPIPVAQPEDGKLFRMWDMTENYLMGTIGEQNTTAVVRYR